MKALLFLLASPVAADMPWAGTWGWGDCDALAAFSAEAVASESSYCVVTNFRPIDGMPAWQVSVDCHHGGDVYPQERLFMWEEHEGRFWTWLPGTEPVEMLRCE